MIGSLPGFCRSHGARRPRLAPEEEANITTQGGLRSNPCHTDMMGVAGRKDRAEKKKLHR